MFSQHWTKDLIELNQFTKCVRNYQSPKKTFPQNENLDLFRHIHFTSILVDGIPSNYFFIHFIREPYHALQSGYNYHFSGRENIKKAPNGYHSISNNPINCFECISEEEREKMGVEQEFKQLQTKVDDILENNSKSKHSDILQILNEENGLIYEACWEFCHIFQMLKAKKASESLLHVFNIDMDIMVNNPDEIEENLKAFLGSEIKIPNIKNHLSQKGAHTSSFNQNEKDEQMSRIKNIDTIKIAYDAMLQKYNYF